MQFQFFLLHMFELFYISQSFISLVFVLFSFNELIEVLCSIVDVGDSSYFLQLYKALLNPKVYSQRINLRFLDFILYTFFYLLICRLFAFSFQIFSPHLRIINNFFLIDHRNNLGRIDMSIIRAFAFAHGTITIHHSYAFVLIISDAAAIVTRFKTIVALGDIAVHITCDFFFCFLLDLKAFVGVDLVFHSCYLTQLA